VHILNNDFACGRMADLMKGLYDARKGLFMNMARSLDIYTHTQRHKNACVHMNILNATVSCLLMYTVFEACNI
jgi:hypothetical protein